MYWDMYTDSRLTDRSRMLHNHVQRSTYVKSTDHLHVDEIGQNHLPIDATSEQFSVLISSVNSNYYALKYQ